MSRGDRRQAIFADDPDRQRFVETLTEACQKTGWQVHAYCLMENHFHLVVETPQPNLVSGMKWLLGTYTSRYNRRRQSVPSVPWDAFKIAKTPVNRPLGRWDALKSGAGGGKGHISVTAQPSRRSPTSSDAQVHLCRLCRPVPPFVPARRSKSLGKTWVVPLCRLYEGTPTPTHLAAPKRSGGGRPCLTPVSPLSQLNRVNPTKSE